MIYLDISYLNLNMINDRYVFYISGHAIFLAETATVDFSKDFIFSPKRSF